MIQPISDSFGPLYHVTAVNSAAATDQLSFQRWQSRREAARQQLRRLSRRELQVVELVSNGMANKAIALELEISVKTIEKHRANATRKLGIGSTAELVKLSVLADHESETVNRLETTAPHGPLSSASDN